MSIDERIERIHIACKEITPNEIGKVVRHIRRRVDKNIEIEKDYTEMQPIMLILNWWLRRNPSIVCMQIILKISIFSIKVTEKSKLQREHAHLTSDKSGRQFKSFFPDLGFLTNINAKPRFLHFY
ncbi:hypothetical protein ABEB36_005645 [Hypothenemus hampei]|uniref:Uncharacterized protein n=1 Tax=Hypothenemus hampei TaxID=57062 RepID=A0ABD1F2T6_HYPHA